MILRLDDAPTDPIERLAWLGGVRDAVISELDREYADAYFDARLSGRFAAALSLGLHSKKAALRFTRRANNERRRMVRWNDGVDPTSSQYTG